MYYYSVSNPEEVLMTVVVHLKASSTSLKYTLIFFIRYPGEYVLGTELNPGFHLLCAMIHR